MAISAFVSTLFIFFTLQVPLLVHGTSELRSLMVIKSTLDPHNLFLSSWTINGDPCDGSFEGVACNERGQVANISLQGKGLTGKRSPASAGLKHLTGLYLHYNSLYGEIPVEIANLTQLSDLYLNVNNLSGTIPAELGKMATLQGVLLVFFSCLSLFLVFLILIWVMGFRYFWKMGSHQALFGCLEKLGKEGERHFGCHIFSCLGVEETETYIHLSLIQLSGLAGVGF